MFINGARAGAVDQQHTTIDWPVKPGESLDVRIVVFAARCACRHILEGVSLAWVDAPAEKLLRDLAYANEVLRQLPAGSSSRKQIANAVEAAFSALDLREVVEVERPAGFPAWEGGLFYESIAGAQAFFDRFVADHRLAATPPEVVALGHAHIDLAWLWPISQSRHKCVRTFATQCRLLEQYPDWIFQQSSPQAYAWVEEDAPDLFEKIRGWVKEGRWDADGAAWVEFDTNVSGGESIVRQLLYGRRWFRDKLGVDSRVLWLPDVFGYSAALPQLLRLAGVDGFVTSKISWNEFNRFPHDTFRWIGIDGSEVVTHFITTPCSSNFLTYGATMTVEDAVRNREAYRQKEWFTDPLLAYGYGDGGGGPTPRMLDTALRLKNMPLSPDVPRVRFENCAGLMDRIREVAPTLPEWDGELYLEYHRGTYTSQAWLKRANRKNEVRLHQLEWIGALAERHGYAWDKPAIDRLWQDLLLMQFHDILPGSSVGEAYAEVRPVQERIARDAETMTADACKALAASIDTSGHSDPVVLFNTLSWDWTAPVQMPGGAWRDDLVIPAGGWLVTDAATPAAESAVPAAEAAVASSDGKRLECPFWTIEFDEKGRIARLYDRANRREVLEPGGAGNEWQAFEDRTLDADAWNIEVYFEQHRMEGPRLVSVRCAETGPVRAAVEMIWEMPPLPDRETSRIVQTIAVYARSPRIDFETRIDWHDHHTLLKVAFPVAVRARTATYEIQFGHLPRPTHRNTSWDHAQFEVCAQRFADLSECGYGVSMLNDCKYGHDIRDNTIRLTCLKAAQSPDAWADRGLHEFTYSLLPHAGSFQEAGVVRMAAELNTPPVALPVDTHPGPLPASWRFVDCAQPAVIVETVKPAEDGGGVIVRLYESHGSRVRARLSFGLPVRVVEECDLMEEPRDGGIDLVAAGDGCELSLRPFQLVTLRLEFAP